LNSREDLGDKRVGMGKSTGGNKLSWKTIDRKGTRLKRKTSYDFLKTLSGSVADTSIKTKLQETRSRGVRLLDNYKRAGEASRAQYIAQNLGGHSCQIPSSGLHFRKKFRRKRGERG